MADEPASGLPESTPPERRVNERAPGFTPLVLDKTVIAVPLLDRLAREMQQPGERPLLYDVIIDVNLDYQTGREGARARVLQLLEDILGERKQDARVRTSEQYVFARLEGEQIRELV